MSRSYDIFLSHSGAQKKFVDKLSEELKRDKRFSVFFDRDSIEFGEKISVIFESARTCKLFVAVLSEEYFTKTRPPMQELAASYTAFKDGRGTAPCLLPVFLAIRPEVAKTPANRTERLDQWTEWELTERMGNDRDRISRVEPGLWQDALDELFKTRGPVYVPDDYGNSSAMFAKEVARIIAENLEKLNRTTVPAKGEKGKEVYKVPCPEETVIGHESLAECSSRSQSSDERPASPSAPLPTAGAQSPPPEPQPEPQSRQWDRRLRILVLGDLELVKKVVRHMCGDVESTQVQGHVNLTESISSSSPVCLYYDTSGRGHRVSTDIRNFVAARNKGWYFDEVKGSWKGNKHCEPGRVGKRLKLFHNSRARLHMVWYVCKTRSNLPSASLIWPEITEKLYDLPVQILVTGEQAPEVLKREHRHINGNDWFPNARNVEELIVKVALTDGEVAKAKLLHDCWTAKTRAEIGNAAETIAWMRKKLGPEGKSDPHGVAARTKKSFSLSQSGELILNYLCTYWDRDSEKLFVVLRETLNWGEKTSKVIIKPVRGFVLFCLQAAAIILYSAGKPAESLKVEAQTCLDRYFQELSPAAFDRMTLPDIQEFLESVFERQDSLPNSLMKRLSAVPENGSICPCWKMVIKNRSVTPAR